MYYVPSVECVLATHRLNLFVLALKLDGRAYAMLYYVANAEPRFKYLKCKFFSWIVDRVIIFNSKSEIICLINKRRIKRMCFYSEKILRCVNWFFILGIYSIISVQ